MPRVLAVVAVGLGPRAVCKEPERGSWVMHAFAASTWDSLGGDPVPCTVAAASEGPSTVKDLT